MKNFELVAWPILAQEGQVWRANCTYFLSSHGPLGTPPSMEL
jgi:hypothetical protein